MARRYVVATDGSRKDFQPGDVLFQDDVKDSPAAKEPQHASGNSGNVPNQQLILQVQSVGSQDFVSSTVWDLVLDSWGRQPVLCAATMWPKNSCGGAGGARKPVSGSTGVGGQRQVNLSAEVLLRLGLSIKNKM